MFTVVSILVSFGSLFWFLRPTTSLVQFTDTIFLANQKHTNLLLAHNNNGHIVSMRLVNTVEHLASKEKGTFSKGFVGDRKRGSKEREHQTDF